MWGKFDCNRSDYFLVGRWCSWIGRVVGQVQVQELYYPDQVSTKSKIDLSEFTPCLKLESLSCSKLEYLMIDGRT